jgi:hypothetical protein
MWLPSRLGADHWLLFDSLPLIMSWGGVAFDLLVTPLLLWKRTRVLGFAWAVAFHLMNANIFGIASFPWMSLALTLLFFDADWPRKQWPSLRGKPEKVKAAKPLTRFGFAALTSYAAVQVLLPMRPWFYPDNPNWTEQGHQFSWHMMLRAKDAAPTFYAELADGRRVTIDPLRYVTERQLSRIRGLPDLMHQFALFVADEYERNGSPRPKVFVDAKVSLNGRPPVPLIDPSVDLAAEPRRLGPAPWLMPSPSDPPWQPGQERQADYEED